MKIWIILLAMVGGATICSADLLSELACHDKVVESGRGRLQCVSELEALFGASNVDHVISEFGSRTHTPAWHSATYFGGRYMLTLEIPIVIDYRRCKFVGVAGKIEVQINEAVRVSVGKSGTVGAEYKGQWRLDESGWRRLVDANGDWSAVNIPIRTNAPVPHFEQYAEEMRALIRDRKKNFDDKIRKTLDDIRRTQSKSNRAIDGTTQSVPVAKSHLRCYESILKDGQRTLTHPGDVEALFGATNVDHFISGFEVSNRPLWHSVAYFGGKYRLWLQIPISVDTNLCKLRGAINSAMVEVDEISRVTVKNSSLAGATIKQRWHIGEADWENLVKSRGDWSVLQLPIVTNKVVAGFNEYTHGERGRLLEQRQKDYDSLIREAIDKLPYPVSPP